METRTLNLGVAERVLFNNVMPLVVPAQSNRVMYRQIENFGKDLSMSPEDIKKSGMKFEGEMFINIKTAQKFPVPKGQIMWSNEFRKDIEISMDLFRLIVRALGTLDMNDKLPREAIGLYDKFTAMDKADQLIKEKAKSNGDGSPIIDPSKTYELKEVV